MMPDSHLEKFERPTERTPERSPLIRRRGPDSSVLAGLFKVRRGQNFEGTGFQGGPVRRQGYKLALWSWLASMIDGLILISLSCIFLVTFSFLMQAHLQVLLKGLVASQHQWLIFFEVFAVCAWIYTIGVRGLLGSTIGEWACDIRLGQPQERLRGNYVLRVAARSTLIVLTGLITLPIVSLIVGQDIAGRLTGLRLFSLK